MRKDLAVKELRSLLLDLCDIVDIIGIGKQKIMASLLKEDFSNSPIPAILPDSFLKICQA